MEIELPDEIEEIDTSEPSRAEVRTRNRQHTSRAAQSDINYATTKVKEIIDIVWKDEKTPRKWRKGLIVKLPKKGNLKECKKMAWNCAAVSCQ